MKIYAKIYPNSKDERVEVIDDTYKVYVKEIAEKGRANKSAIKVVAKHFGIPVTRVKIKVGFTTKNKIIEINI